VESISYKFYYSGPLLFKTKISEEVLKELEKISNSKKDYRYSLAGAIQEEYKLDTYFYSKLLKPYFVFYKQAFKNWYNWEITTDIKVISAWINKMKGGEFNPPHIHTGCKLSSVIFMNNLSEEVIKERKEYKGTHIGKPASINFNYSLNSDELFIQESNHVPERGDFFIFPARLTHWVFPYKSNFTRISIAANYDF
tara:strand:+ start:501 stop:1088 length:588 start_codon:yes stop_codon:yes gene_type:complete